MGRKVNANIVRMGINKTWNSVWYTDKRFYPALLMEDIKIKKLVTKKIHDAGIDKIEIRRSQGKVDVDVFVARPGVAIGRGGEGIDILQKELKAVTKKDIEIKVREVKKADLSARVLARFVADGIERRQPSKLLVMKAKERAMMAGAKGVRIWVSGRINNASQARVVKVDEGSVPAQTLRADIDFAQETATTIDAGLMGVKVWIYKGDKTEVNSEE
jgi:small subunit ribosomal protein S3